MSYDMVLGGPPGFANQTSGFGFTRDIGGRVFWSEAASVIPDVFSRPSAAWLGRNVFGAHSQRITSSISSTRAIYVESGSVNFLPQSQTMNAHGWVTTGADSETILVRTPYGEDMALHLLDAGVVEFPQGVHPNGGVITSSVYVQPQDATSITLTQRDGLSITALFSPMHSIVTGSGTGLISSLEDNWYRVHLTADSLPTDSFRVEVNGSSIVYGAQVEPQARASSLIPTTITGGGYRSDESWVLQTPIPLYSSAVNVAFRFPTARHNSEPSVTLLNLYGLTVNSSHGFGATQRAYDAFHHNTDWHVVTLQHNPITGVAEMFVDGELVSSLGGMQFTKDDIIIGGSHITGGQKLNGIIAPGSVAAGVPFLEEAFHEPEDVTSMHMQWLAHLTSDGSGQ